VAIAGSLTPSRPVSIRPAKPRSNPPDVPASEVEAPRAVGAVGVGCHGVTARRPWMRADRAMARRYFRMKSRRLCVVIEVPLRQFPEPDDGAVVGHGAHGKRRP